MKGFVRSVTEASFWRTQTESLMAPVGFLRRSVWDAGSFSETHSSQNHHDGVNPKEREEYFVSSPRGLQQVNIGCNSARLVSRIPERLAKNPADSSKKARGFFDLKMLAVLIPHLILTTTSLGAPNSILNDILFLTPIFWSFLDNSKPLFGLVAETASSIL